MLNENANDNLPLMSPPHPEYAKKLMNTRRFLEGAIVEPNDMVSIGEFLSYTLKKDEQRAVFYKSSSKNIIGKAKLRSIPTPTKALVLCIGFSGKQGQLSIDVIRDKLFSDNTASPRSFRDYYIEVSNGKLKVSGEVFGWYNSNNKIRDFIGSYEVNDETVYDGGCPDSRKVNPHNNKAQLIVKDAVDAAVAGGAVNFKDYDVDGDGYVDFLIVLHAGSDANYFGTPKDDLRSHYSAMNEDISAGDVKVRDYVFVSEYDHEYDRYGNRVNAHSIGTVCHEFGHALGFPDLYDRNNKTWGIGHWCLMSYGMWNDEGHHPSHPCAWLKAKMGWIEPVTMNASREPADIKVAKDFDRIVKSFNEMGIVITINETVLDMTVNIDEIENSLTNSAYKVYLDKSNEKEFFIMENRQKKKFDKDLPGQGLLIWHIDESMNDNDSLLPFSQILYINKYIKFDVNGSLPWTVYHYPAGRHQLVALEQADNRRDLENADPLGGDAGDPYPGTSANRQFSMETSPSSKGYYYDEDFLINISDISDSRSSMSARLMINDRVTIRPSVKKDVFNDIMPHIVKQVVKRER